MHAAVATFIIRIIPCRRPAILSALLATFLLLIFLAVFALLALGWFGVSSFGGHLAWLLIRVDADDTVAQLTIIKATITAMVFFVLRASEMVKAIVVSLKTSQARVFPNTLLQQWIIKFACHSSFFQFLSNTSLNLFLSLDPASFKVLIFPFKALFILSECTVHHSVEILLHFFNVLFCTHKSLHKNIEFFIKPYDLDTGVAEGRVVERVLTSLRLVVVILVLIHCVDRHRRGA